MSDIEELRLRLEDAEKRFGLKTAETPHYSVCLVRLVDAIIEDLWVQQRDNKRLTFENKEFRVMLMSMLSTLEGGDKDALRTLMTNMVERLTTLIKAGAGAPGQQPVLEKYPEPVPDPEPEPEPEPVPVPEPVPAPEPEPENIDVETITAAVAELANNTAPVAPVLDLPAASAAEDEAREVPPVSAPLVPEAPEAPEEVEASAAPPVPAERGEHADLYNILSDIRRLAGQLGSSERDLTQGEEAS